MEMRDGVVAYIVASNLEAQDVCSLLRAEGISAMAVEDASPAGMWIGGLAPQLHKPEVWVQKADAERVHPILEAYKQRLAKRQDAGVTGKSVDGELITAGSIEATCEECGQRSTFPISQNETVQTCPHCGEFMDVGNIEEIEGWDDAPKEPDA